MNIRAEPRSAENRSANIEKLAELINDVEIAMLTTVARSGHLVSRPLGTQEVEFDGDLWFATECDSGKAAEIEANPYVNVAYASPSKDIYVSVAGRASLVRDRAKIDALWSPRMQSNVQVAKDDPNLCLIRVEADSAEYWDGHGRRLGQVLHLFLSAVTDEPANLQENERIDLR
ncbi:MAG: pyridoxamine 5'-phosphate oxidase family protein [Pseudomonadota bacterium]|jgi:general stress protein 26|nr:pyridoxamine 5'-phosphate oxidase family protein [Pseudomonadota bacterium]